MNEFEKRGIAWWNNASVDERLMAVNAAAPDASVADMYRQHVNDQLLAACLDLVHLGNQLPFDKLFPEHVSGNMVSQFHRALDNGREAAQEYEIANALRSISLRD